LLTTSEGSRLASWVHDTGKQPRANFVTHGHADHFFGAGPVLAAFPDAQLLACDQEVVDEAHAQATPEAMASWDSWFAGQFSHSPSMPTLTSSAEIDLDGHPILFSSIGGADGALNTIVEVPDLQAICSGDIVYNNIHMWLRDSTPASRDAWLASLDAVATRKPSTIITGHKDPAAPDDNATRVLDQSRRYIEDFGQAVADSSASAEVITTMLAKYPGYGNPYTLFASASDPVIKEPATIIATPATLPAAAPTGMVFSARTNTAMAAIHKRFITPPTNSNAIRTQQQPRQ
jgi:glyoxylase-like metal-dependent hydrolase (beta-lactamase superfamily II)